MPLNRFSPAELRRAFLAGKTYAEISQAFGCGHSTVYRYKQALGLTAPPAGPKIDVATMREMHAAGWTVKQVARHFACSCAAVWRASQRLGLSWKRKRDLAIAEWVTWEKPVPGPNGVVDRDLFIEILRERGIVGTACYLNISPAAVSQRACRLRRKGLLGPQGGEPYWRPGHGQGAPA